MPLDKISLTPGANTHLDVDVLLNEAIDKVNEIDAQITGGSAGEVLKKAGSGDYDYGWEEDISDGVRETGASVVLKTKVIQIGDWNMDSTASITVNHGIADFSKIRSIDVIVREDLNTGRIQLTVPSSAGVAQGSIGVITSTYVSLGRTASGVFDDPAYDSTGFNRGWITIIHEA